MEINGVSIITMPIVVFVTYGVIEILKQFVFSKNEKIIRLIPVMATGIGAVIALVIFFAAPESLPIPTWYGALITGAASGLSAVGVNQITKQAKKKGGAGNGS